MYRHCIFCTSDLGANAALEEWPVGRELAFDPALGRLWVVCGRCGRWNLAPIEERWEAIETAERLFRDSARRVQLRNIGVAHLSDRTKLVRIGDALPGEFASWRYARRLAHRRWLHALKAAAGLLLGVPWWPGIYLRNKPAAVAADAAGTPARGMPVLWKQLDSARVLSQAGNLKLVIQPRRLRGSTSHAAIEGPAAEELFTRVLGVVNQFGASPADIQTAIARLASSSGALSLAAQLETHHSGEELVLRELGRTGIWRVRSRSSSGSRYVTRAELLSLEMAANEHAERAAFQGDLTRLRIRWREAEQIAAIADSL